MVPKVAARGEFQEGEGSPSCPWRSERPDARLGETSTAPRTWLCGAELGRADHGAGPGLRGVGGGETRSCCGGEKCAARGPSRALLAGEAAGVRSSGVCPREGGSGRCLRACDCASELARSKPRSAPSSAPSVPAGRAAVRAGGHEICGVSALGSSGNVNELPLAPSRSGEEPAWRCSGESGGCTPIISSPEGTTIGSGA
mmetsp:Transcript_4413/g.11272  ORF Transcript_4413/g.11272 Transcript_4413/m.11272 type:complete len:200 (+) Transcript_4413:505-1104(+)